MNKAEELQAKFIKKGWTLALAESCTGGALSARLVEIPDASLYFLGSVVAYSNSAKMNLLGVKKETLDQFGAVSEETAIEMAQGARERFKSTVAFSVTGIAGPDGGTREKSVGTVCFALVTQKQTESWTEHFQGDRQEVIAKSAHLGLQKVDSIGGHP